MKKIAVLGTTLAIGAFTLLPGVVGAVDVACYNPGNASLADAVRLADQFGSAAPRWFTPAEVAEVKDKVVRNRC